MQLMRTEFSAVRRPGPPAASWSGPRPSLITVTSTTKKPMRSPPASLHRRLAASRREDAESGRQVDEGMAELRRRIHEMDAAERGWEESPTVWTVPEEDWYAAYDAADVCDIVVGLLRASLVGARPGVGVGLLAALALAVPASAFVLVYQILDVLRALISNLQH